MKKTTVNQKKHIFLLGFMATGKSTIGKKVAKRLTIPFLDLDHCIEEWEQKTISEIFAEKGEDYFRKTESTVLHNLIYQEPSFIATGGGTPCFHDNMDFMLQNGRCIYLKTKTEILLGRLRQQRDRRPLVARLTDEELQEFIESKIAERSPFYERADFVVENNGAKTVLIEEITKILKS